MKLYSNIKEQYTPKAFEQLNITNSKSDINLDKDITSLEDHINAYNSLNIVYSQISLENFSFIDKNNYIIYNEYIKSITSNLNMKPVIISQEAIDTLPIVVVNHHISLEGFIKDMWEKIKSIFNKIYESVKQFFVNYFTRLGRIKKKLENLKEVLSETDKDIKNSVLDPVPSNIGSKYPVSGDISFTIVENTFNNVITLSNALVSINKAAKDLANKEIIGKDFVSQIKALKDIAKQHKDQIDKNSENKTGGVKQFYGEGKQNNKDIDTENKNLGQLAKTAENEAADKEGEIKAVVSDNDNLNVEFDDTDFIAATKEFEELLKIIEKEFSKVNGKMLIGGKVITKVEVSKDNGINIETEVNKESPSSVHLATKSNLIKLVNDTISAISNSDNVSKNYTEVNETIIKNLDIVDKLIKDLDSISEGDLGKYKKVLTNKIRERLNLMKNFFNNFNKVNKNVFQMLMEVSEGNVDYTVLSLKNFG